MKFGMNLLLWTAEISDEHLPVLEKLKEMGYDGVEVPIFSDDPKKFARLGKQLDDLGLERTAVTVRTAADNPISPDRSIRQTGHRANRRGVECCQALGGTVLCGPYHSALGEFAGRGPTEDELNWAAEGLADMAEAADEAGLTLGVEYLNRFECYLINSAAEAVKLLEMVNHPRCKTMFDTFHANIEEKDFAQAIRTAAPYLAHVHISENDRSTPGVGNVSWDATFDTLKAINYDGWLMVEAFGLALPELAAATKIWRRMFESEEQLSRDALAFMKQQWAARA